MRLSIILPTYNERKNILNLIPQLENLAKKFGKKSEIIVVDDSSPDGTADLARKLNKKYRNIKVILRQKKEGMGAAIKAGFDNANGDILVSIDVDSLGADDIEKMLDKLGEGYDLVAGSRRARGGLYKKSFVKTFIKNIVSSFGNKLATFIIGIDFTDFSLNCRAMKKKVWESIDVLEKGNSFMLETVVKAHFAGFKIGEVPVVFNERKHGKSKLNLGKQSFLFFKNIIAYALKYRLKIL